MDSGRRDGLRRETVALLGPGETEILTVPRLPTEATKTIERQVVKPRCRYCGNLGDEIAGKCSKCGAGL